MQFDFAWESNLLELQRELVEGEYEPGPYHHFYIFDPKKRKISAAPFRDRIVHHAVVRVLEPIYERRFMYDSYACRKGKGTHRAIDRAQHFLQRHDFYLKTDIVSFFPSVDHEILSDILRRRIRDERLFDLITRILDSGSEVHAEDRQPFWFPGDDLFSPLRPKGLPIGNLTSQFLANVILDEADHFIKEQLRVPGYVRYADDLVLFGNSKADLHQWHRELTHYLAALRLRLHRDKTQVAPHSAGLPFLGLRLRRDRLPRLLPQRINRFSRRLRRQKQAFAAGKLDAQQIKSSCRAWLATTRHTNSRGLRADLWKRLTFRRSTS